jgi:hypothetical protein
MIDINEGRSLSDEEFEIFDDAFKLNRVFKVEDSEAWRAARSAHEALERYIVSAYGLGDGLNARSVATMMIEQNRLAPHVGIEQILKTKWVADEVYHKDIPAFYDWVARTLKKKRPAFRGVEKSEYWKVFMIAFWSKSWRGMPPQCLWSDALFLKAHSHLTSEAAVRKEISRLKLYRPKSPCYGPGDAPRDYIKFVKRGRGVVTKKK